MAVRVFRQLAEEELIGYVRTYLIKRMLALPFLPASRCMFPTSENPS